MPRTLDIDVLVFGGGIAGLWTLARVRGCGYRSLLLESRALGATQSIGSQGIIHGGVKYALLGEASTASRAIAEMPARWADCLAGRGEVDLSAVRTISPCTYLWTTPGLVSRVAGLAASKALRTPVERVPVEDRPPVFAGAPRGVDVYRVGEPVLDARSVLFALVDWRHCPPVRYDTLDAASVRAVDGRASLRVSVAGEWVEARAAHIVLTAGAGNEALLGTLAPLGPPVARMQKRPLHMVMLRAPASMLPPLFGHCLGASSLPRLTVTGWASDSAAAGGEGDVVWYIGGQVAERGVDLSREAQIDAARAEVVACVPWINTSACRWATVRWDRAEGLTDDGRRPDLPVLHSSPLVSAAWPSKLALAPLLADQMVARLGELGVRARGLDEPVAPGLSPAAPAPLPWNDPGVVWT